MSFHRRMTRPDANQGEIVLALREAGIMVWVIGEPCDLLTFYRGRWKPIEIKSSKRKRNDQEAQDAFLKATDTPKVTTAMEALLALSVIHAVT
jgi:hypothetical protein